MEIKTVDSKEYVGKVRNIIWNRRYRAWGVWFCSFLIITAVCILTEAIEILQLYAQWSTVGLVALIGGLSVTDFMALKKEK